jgi:hypothetical protein
VSILQHAGDANIPEPENSGDAEKRKDTRRCKFHGAWPLVEIGMEVRGRAQYGGAVILSTPPKEMKIHSDRYTQNCHNNL